MKSNPFTASMTTLAVPPHMSTSISIEGFTFEADDDRCVEVPERFAAQLRAHGLKDYVPPPPSSGKVGQVSGSK